MQPWKKSSNGMKRDTKQTKILIIFVCFVIFRLFRVSLHFINGNPVNKNEF
jgi:hypothetical protein